MGRVKNSKQNKSKLMKTNVSKRWAPTSNVDEGRPRNETVTNCAPASINPSPMEVDSLPRPRPSTSCEGKFRLTENLSDDRSDDEAQMQTPEKHERPRGFALVSRYDHTVTLDDEASVYCLADLNILKGFLSDMPCKFCLDSNTVVTHTYPSSFVVQISIKCKSCNQTTEFKTSKTFTDPSTNRRSSDINRRVVSTFSSMGKGHRAIETFCMGLNMPCITHKSYDKQIEKVTAYTSLHAQEALQRARHEVEKVYSELQGSLNLEKPINIAVSYDGTWQKRGFTSKYGVGCIIEVLTGLVIDYEVLSKYCRVCEAKKKKTSEDSDEFQAWYLTHEQKCQANFEGSSPAMETEAAERLWRRSEEIGFRYTSVISDGDSKTHDHLQSLKVYGEGIAIEKHECVNHVAKRLGTGLRNIRKVCAAKKMRIGGKKHGSLKLSTIDKLTKYYRNAIINHLGDEKEMKKAIFATLDHCRSTDQVPRHKNCPTGKDSWCFYQRDLGNKVVPRKHAKFVRTPLNEEVVKQIIPVYVRLSNNELLKRCSEGKTQNANESLHGVIWTKCPKTVFTAKRKVEAAVGEGISIYNEGHLLTMTQLMKKVGLSPGTNTASHAKKRDSQRLKIRKARTTEKYKKYRKLLKSSQLKEEESRKAREGKSYGAGEF